MDRGAWQTSVQVVTDSDTAEHTHTSYEPQTLKFVYFLVVSMVKKKKKTEEIKTVFLYPCVLVYC